MPGGSEPTFSDPILPIPSNVGPRHPDHPAPTPSADQPRQVSFVLGDNRGMNDEVDEKKKYDHDEPVIRDRDDFPDLMNAVFEHEEAVREFIDRLEIRRSSHPKSRPSPVAAIGVGSAVEHVPQPDRDEPPAAIPTLPDQNQPNAGPESGPGRTNFARAVVKAPEVFSGEYTFPFKGRKEVTCTEWCDTMERYLLLNHVPEEDQVTFVQTYLRGGALSLSTLALQQAAPSETGSNLEPVGLRPTIKNWR